MRLVGIYREVVDQRQMAVWQFIDQAVGVFLDLSWWHLADLAFADKADQRLLRRAAGFVLLGNGPAESLASLPDKPFLLVGGQVLEQARTARVLTLPNLTFDGQGQLSAESQLILSEGLQRFIRLAADFNAAQGKSDRFPSFRTGLAEVDLVSGASDEWDW